MKLPYPEGLAEGAAQFGIELKSHATIDPTSGFRRWARFHGESIFGVEARTADFLGGSKTPITLNVKAPVRNTVTAPSGGIRLSTNDVTGLGARSTAANRAALGLRAVPAKAPAITGAYASMLSAVDRARKAVVPAQPPARTPPARAPMKLGDPIFPSFVIPGKTRLPKPAAAAALASADKLLSDPRIQNAAEVIDNTKALAALGDEDARRGAAVLEAVASARQSAGTAPGQPLIPIDTPEQLAMVEAAAPSTVRYTPLADVQQLVTEKKKEGWFTRFLSLFGLAIRKD